MNNFVIVVLDGVGIGEMPDAENYSDEGSDTLGNMAKRLGGLDLPNLEKLGLGNIKPITGIKEQIVPLASFGKLKEISAGKDSTTGHWELGGLKVDVEFPYYPDGFPDEIINKFLKETGCKGILGNYKASGTEIINELGSEHFKTGYPIIYTSADSVFQIASHENIIPLERLYEICKICRYNVMTGMDAVARIIARPFTGEKGNFVRTTNRVDFSLNPPSQTILDYCLNAGVDTYAIGKINDLFNYNGIKYRLKTKSNQEGINKIIETSRSVKNSLIFANLVDFDVYYGHRNNMEGFHKELQKFDKQIPEIISSLDETDKLIFTADHGNDPTDISTDHTREYVPLLYYRKSVLGKNLGIRETFSDVAQTAAEYFGIENNLSGTSFLND